MGRKRKKKIEAGEYYSVYIPKDINPKVLKFLQGQPYLSKAIFQILTDYLVNGKNTLEQRPVSVSKNVEIDMEAINRTLKSTIESTIKEALKDLNIDNKEQKQLISAVNDEIDEQVDGISKSDLEFYGKLF